MSCPRELSPDAKRRRMLGIGKVGEGAVNCTYKLGDGTKGSPHVHEAPTRPKVMPNVLYNIGNTPLVKINNIVKDHGIKCNVYAKCEFFNAGGSVKDRIGARMVMEAERAGTIKPGDTLIEPTSGNTGIGLALAAAVKGYKCIIVLPEKMSNEKVNVLRALGAEIVRTPTEAASDSPESHVSVAFRLEKELPNAHILNQYENPYNPIAHYDGTGAEILESLDNKVDMIVAGVGTGGTISGIARRVKETCPDCVVVGADPHGSILAPGFPEEDVGYEVEGIGYDFIPTVCERKLVDKWFKCEDKSGFQMARRLIRDEGLLCGGSSGCAMAVAMQAAKDLKEGQNCVVVLPDSVRNYMTKFLTMDWMVRRGFVDTPPEEDEFAKWGDATVGDLQLSAPVTVVTNDTCGKAVEVLRKGGFDQLPVVDASGKTVGLITLGQLLARSSTTGMKKIAFSDPVSKVMFKFKKLTYKSITPSTKLATLKMFFEKNSAAFVTSDEDSGRVVGVLTKIDLLAYLERLEREGSK